MATHDQVTLNFTVLCEKYDNGFLAHCVETGLVSSAPEEMDAISKMGKMLVREVTFALKHNRLADIYHLAPRDVVNKMIDLERRIVSRTERPITYGHKQVAITEMTAYAPAC